MRAPNAIKIDLQSLNNEPRASPLPSQMCKVACLAQRQARQSWPHHFGYTFTGGSSPHKAELYETTHPKYARRRDNH